jgi:hypothetical protein
MAECPFEVGFDVLQDRLDEFVSIVFASLESEFLILPKGPGFVEYATFEQGYQVLKKATAEFTIFTIDIVLPAVLQTPIALLVLRAMLGFTPPEWAYMATRRMGVKFLREPCVRWIGTCALIRSTPSAWAAWPMRGSRR